MRDDFASDRWRRVALDTDRNSDDVRLLFSNIVENYDFLNRLLTMGIDDYLRRQAVRAARIQPDGIVVDAGTGTGELAFKAAGQLGPGGRVYGVDFCAPMLERAQKKAQQLGLGQQVSFLLEDVRTLSFPDRFADQVLMGFALRNIPEVELVLAEVHRILKPGGRFVCLELFQMETGFLSPFVRPYLYQIVPRVAALFVPSNEYVYLPHSLTSFPKLRTLLGLFPQAGFGRLSARVFFGGLFGILCGETVD